jgi:hypothetical protein
MNNQIEGVPLNFYEVTGPTKAIITIDKTIKKMKSVMDENEHLSTSASNKSNTFSTGIVQSI